MTTITLKNVPRPLYERLKAAAKRNRRSLNQEAIVSLERALGPQPVDVDELLTVVRAQRSRLSSYLTDEDIRTARDEGRP
jgi:antitoxin FitA